ncbi:hypothetical protein SHELI_v1c02260 [Spiroplasma helicoides]|uniref:Ribosomal processing cysteine protease Prp n=1 Tax=Spiroplasma helicoides TaxID=216938 RepID=A0A1B3SJS7_9MOLU|nr:ribosomal-processing cysteine protease Prp [Spiroplasma helicoides]AOG60181.1 hypothetical protein SHELI_v1c02260 [Spiroplasma helicoides]
MVFAKIYFKDQTINKIEINGHANFAKYGNDLVCAGITAIVNGALNGFDQIFKNEVELNVLENLVTIEIKKSTEYVKNVISFLLIQLKTIEVQYPKNFKIEEVF